MSGRATPWWIFLVAAAFLAYYGLMLHVEWSRIESLGFRVEFTDGAMVVQHVRQGSAAADAGIRDADRVVMAGGRPIGVRGDWHAVEANLSAGRAVPVVVERGARKVQLFFTPRRSPPGFWRTKAGVVLAITRLTQLVALWIACVLIFRRPRDGYAQLGALVLGSGAVFSIVLPIGLANEWRHLSPPADTILWLPFTSSICVGGILFTFFAAFPRPLFTSRLLWAIAWTPLVLVVGSYLAAFGAAVYRPTAPGPPLDSTFVLIASAFYEGAGLLVLGLNYSRLHDVTDRRRVRAIMPGSIAALVAGIVVAIASLRRGPIDMARPLFDSQLLAIGALVMLALPISFAYAILSRRMFDFATLLRAGVRYALARRVVLMLPFLLVGILAADVGVHADMTLGQLVVWRLAVYLPLAVVAGFTVWYREHWLAGIDRRFFRQRYDAEQIVRGIISDLRHSGTVEGVAPSLVARLENAMHPSFAALMLRETRGARFETLTSAPAGAAPPPLSATSKLVALARVLGAPLRLGASDEEPLVRGLPLDERRLVSESRIDLLALVPAQHDVDRELLIVLGPKRSEEPYTADDLDLVNGIADALSLAAGRAPQPRATAPSLAECPECGRCYDSGTERCAEDDRPLHSGHIGRVLADRYRLDRKIGQGGMSRLYAAVDVALEREVAVKVLREEWLTTADSEARFRREARLAAALSHPNIVTVFDFGVSDRTAFLVMELLRGRTLRDELRERHVLPLPEVLGIVRSVGLAMGAAHARGLIHRDLKPENVWLARTDSHGRVKVLDFGLAKSLMSDDEFSTGPLLMGTPSYMAPEQLRGESPATTWDCWALAVVAYELLTGQAPFAGAASAVQAPGLLRTADPWPPLPGPALPDDLQVLEPFFARALAVDPGLRPGTSTALVTALENAAAGVRTTSTPGVWMVWT